MSPTHDSTIHAPSPDNGEPHKISNVDVLDKQLISKDTRSKLESNSPTNSAERDKLAASSVAPNGVSAILGNSRESPVFVPDQQPPSLKLARRKSTSIPSSTSSSSRTSTDSRVKRPSSARPHLNRALSTPIESYFALQPGSSSLEARSPATRRAPASRSSHGIETSSGPPPALSTQRSYSTDPPRMVQPPTELSSAGKLHVRPGLVARKTWGANGSSNSASRPHTSAGSTLEIAEQEGSASRRRSRSSTWSNGAPMATSVDRYLHEFSDDARDRTLRALEGTREGGYAHTAHEDVDDDAIDGLDGQASNEDLFLNLARATSTIEAPAGSTSRRERRRSRISLANHRQNNALQYSSPSSTRPQSNGNNSVDQTSSHLQTQYTSIERWQHRQQERSSPQSLHSPSPPLHYRPSTKARSSAASAHPLDDSGRSRYFGVNHRPSFTAAQGQLSREASPEHQQYNGRRSSIPDTGYPNIPTRAYRQSNLSHSSTRNHYSSPLTHHITDMEHDSPLDTPRPDGTESTVSTAAQSTVWDELEDMKERLRRLELVGKLPQSSAAAHSSASGERPQTATTTVTTISSSPKQGADTSASPADLAFGGPGVAKLHPLLHTTLAKCKPLVSVDVYRALEATASDALALTGMTGYNGPQGTMHSAVSVLGGPSSMDRQVRRKADSMCRSLTELCVALSEDRDDNRATSSTNGVVALRPATNAPPTEPEVGANASQFQRESSQEPNERAFPKSRIVSRLEARRASIRASPSTNSYEDQAQGSITPTQTQTELSKPRRLSRTPTMLLRTRRRDDASNDPEPRPLSRAATEVSSSRISLRERLSKDYSSNLTPPHQSPRSPSSAKSSLPVRRNHLPTSQALTTPNIQPGNRRYLDRSTPPAADSGSRLAEARLLRLGSAGQVTVPVRQRRCSVEGSPSFLTRKLRASSTDPQENGVVEGDPQ